MAANYLMLSDALTWKGIDSRIDKVSRVFDICAIDAGQTRVRYLIFHNGKTMLSGQTDQGITNILLPEALNTFRFRKSIHKTLDKYVTNRIYVYV